jgi:hypothetical protein
MIGPLGVAPADCYRTVAETHVIDMLLLGGWAFEAARGDVVKARSEVHAAIERWIGLGLGFRSRDGVRYFDPVEVINLMTWAGLSELDPFWSERYVQTGRALVVNSAPGASVERRVDVLLRRNFNLQQFEAGDLIRLRMPLPLAGTSVTDISLAPLATPAGSADLRVNDGRAEARLRVPSTKVTEMGMRATFTANRAQKFDGSLDSTDTALYLRPIEGLIRVSPKVRALADALAGDTRGALETVRCFWTYMMDHLRSGMVHYDQVPDVEGCGWVLDHGWFDCQLGSALLVALCRARQIPARLVGGNLLYPLAPTNHFWAEIWIDDRGWTSFDLLSWTLSGGGRDSEWRDHFFARLDFRMVTQVFPRFFTGPMSIRFPERFQMLQSAFGDGVAITFHGLDGVLIYEDRITLKRPPTADQCRA